MNARVWCAVQAYKLKPKLYNFLRRVGAIAIDGSCAAACAAAGTPVITGGAVSATGLPEGATQSASDVSAAADAAPAPQAAARTAAGSGIAALLTVAAAALGASAVCA